MAISNKFSKKILIISVLFFSVSLYDVFAYLDPGAGSLIVQLLIAFGLGVSYYVKVNWKKVKSYFSRHFSFKKGKKQIDE